MLIYGNARHIAQGFQCFACQLDMQALLSNPRHTLTDAPFFTSMTKGHMACCCLRLEDVIFYNK